MMLVAKTLKTLTKYKLTHKSLKYSFTYLFLFLLFLSFLTKIHLLISYTFLLLISIITHPKTYIYTNCQITYINFHLFFTYNYTIIHQYQSSYIKLTHYSFKQQLFDEFKGNEQINYLNLNKYYNHNQIQSLTVFLLYQTI